MQALLVEAGTEAAKIVVSLGTNLVKGAIMGVLVPMLTDALKEGLEEAKEEVKGGEEKEAKGRRPLQERLLSDPEEKGVDTNILHLESCPQQYVWFGPPWTGYQMYTVKFGQDRKTNLFYAIGYDVTLRHHNLIMLDKELREEFKDQKDAPALPALPPDALHGLKCGCIKRVVNGGEQYNLFRPYMTALATKPYCNSKRAAQMFRIGDDYKAQALYKAVFDQAVVDTVEEYLGRPACKWCEFKDPFDEAEGVRQLLYIVMSTTILPRLQAMVNPPICQYNARLTAESALMGALNGAADKWAGAQKGINEIKDKALKAVEEAGAGLVGALKPHLLKVLEKINAKMAGKKKDEDEKKPAPAAFGDETAKWRFERTPVGARLYAAMEKGAHKPAISSTENDLNPQRVLEDELKSIAEAIGGDGAADVPGVSHAIRDVSSKINHQIYRFNTLAPLLDAVKAIAEIRDEEKLLTDAAGNAEGIVKAIETQSLAMWDSGLAKSVLRMFTAYNRIRGQVVNAYRDPVPEKAATAMIEFVDYLFENHVRALNGLRVRYINLLKAALVGDGIANADAISAHSKACFRQAFFEVADILMDDFWVQMCDKIVLYSCQSAYALFLKEAWPEMKELLEPIKSVLPEPVAKANVHEKIIQKIIEVVITKAMTFLTKKLLIWAEKKLFSQESA